MSYQEKLSQVKTLLEKHNQALESVSDQPSPEETIDFDSFKQALVMLGAYSEEDLASLRYEDIATCLPELPSGDRPMFLAKKIAKIFRGKSQGFSPEEVNKMSTKELLDNFNPQRPNGPVGKRLKELSDGKPFLIFKEDNQTIDIEQSWELLKELEAGYQPVDKIMVDDEPKRTYEVGDGPNRYAEENPLYPDRPLRPHGERCDQTGRSWQGVDVRIRQFLRLVVEHQGTPDIDHAHDLIDLAVSDEPLQNLKNRYPDLAIEFKDRKENGTLPNLRVQLGDEGSWEMKVGSKVSSVVFDNGKKVS